MWLVLGLLYETILSGVSLFTVVPFPKFETAAIIIGVVFLLLIVILPLLPKKGKAKFRWHIFYSVVSSGFLINFFIQYIFIERANIDKGLIVLFSIVWVIAIFFRFNKYWTES